MRFPARGFCGSACARSCASAAGTRAGKAARSCSDYRKDGRARIVDFILYDDLDPHALDTGIVRFDGRYFGALWDICKRRGLSVVADVHVHPGGSGQSASDREHPMISRAGHIALILPDFARRADPHRSRSASTAISATSAGTPCRPGRAAPSCTLDCEAAMTAFTPADKLHRLVKHALDSGAAASIAEAEAMFAGYRARRCASATLQARDPHHQAALLTAVALARRVFLGGVTVAMLPDAPLARALAVRVNPRRGGPWRSGPASRALPDGMPLDRDRRRARARAPACFTFERCSRAGAAGSFQQIADAVPAPAPVMPLAPMLAAGLAVNEAFLFVSGQTAVAGRRSVGLVAVESGADLRLAWRSDRRARAATPALAPVADRSGPSRPGLSLGARAAALFESQAAASGSSRHRHHHGVRPWGRTGRG